MTAISNIENNNASVHSLKLVDEKKNFTIYFIRHRRTKRTEKRHVEERHI